MIASLSSFRQTLLRMRAEAAMYLPGGKFTTPPPALLAFSIALLIADVSFVFPSPMAPKSLTFNWRDWSILGCGIVGGVKTLSGGSGGAARANVIPQTITISAHHRRDFIKVTPGCPAWMGVCYRKDANPPCYD